MYELLARTRKFPLRDTAFMPYTIRQLFSNFILHLHIATYRAPSPIRCYPTLAKGLFLPVPYLECGFPYSVSVIPGVHVLYRHIYMSRVVSSIDKQCRPCFSDGNRLPYLKDSKLRSIFRGSCASLRGIRMKKPFQPCCFLSYRFSCPHLLKRCFGNYRMPNFKGCTSTVCTVIYVPAPEETLSVVEVHISLWTEGSLHRMQAHWELPPSPQNFFFRCYLWESEGGFKTFHHIFSQKFMRLHLKEQERRFFKNLHVRD